MNFYLGIDFGTTGARSTAIDSEGKIHSEIECTYESGDLAPAWQNALWAVIDRIPAAIRRQVRAIALDGTSSTVMLCDSDGIPMCEPILYNDARAAAVMEKLRAIAPANHTVLSATSSLAKLLWWLDGGQGGAFFLHQADWLGFLLHGKLGISDYHNALKLGFEVDTLCYPPWLLEGIAGAATPRLPEVVAPGTPVGKVREVVGDRFGFPPDCMVCAGTTDSIAAFLASGVNSPGEAVTSLGSTLAVKLLSHTRVDDARYGIYSHRFPALFEGAAPQFSPLIKGGAGGCLWLVGGASNAGGAVLRHFFTDRELEDLSQQIDPNRESLLDYYPLLNKGDRFPINDPNLQPKLEPRPADSVEFLHGLLESIARIEARGYQLLQELGATGLTKVYTAGGGAKNQVWSAMRKRYLKVPVETPIHTAAACGAALLAMRGVRGG
ncbi:MAG: FGGY-family carbohydrate kinase [Oscillatoriaceae cyanobacterium Prado104]|jgi:xylulokinase|nr:FGGY-family carbohydrate kinase [Oscillatoriaceae cyanobacterium Prado104]